MERSDSTLPERPADKHAPTLPRGGLSQKASPSVGEALPQEPDATSSAVRGDSLRARVAVHAEGKRPFQLVVPRALQPRRDRHARTRVSFLRYSYYDIVFKYFTEQVLDADYLPLPAPTRRTVALGSRNSSDCVCAPFKHILGDYIEGLELGADVLVQFAGPCRLGYYGELQESILRDLGYRFTMLNFSTLTGKPLKEYIETCRKKVNPHLSIPHGMRHMLAVFKMIEALDEANDYYLSHAGFETDPGSFDRALAVYHDDMRQATCERDIAEAQRHGMDTLRSLAISSPENPLRVGIVGEYFTAVDPHSNLGVERKLLDMGVELHRLLNITNRNLHYNEKNLRAGISDYVRYDMGPTSTMTLAATLKYAQEGFDGIIHLKSSGCTPEIDCIPILQQISHDKHIPILYLSYDSQTSDTGLDTRLEAFYDMIAMKRSHYR